MSFHRKGHQGSHSSTTSLRSEFESGIFEQASSLPRWVPAVTISCSRGRHGDCFQSHQETEPSSSAPEVCEDASHMDTIPLHTFPRKFRDMKRSGHLSIYHFSSIYMRRVKTHLTGPADNLYSRRN